MCIFVMSDIEELEPRVKTLDNQNEEEREIIMKEEKPEQKLVMGRIKQEILELKHFCYGSCRTSAMGAAVW